MKGNGKITTVERSIGFYDTVEMAGFYEVEFINGKEGNLTITGEENFLTYIITEVKEGKLILKTEKNYNLKPSNRNGVKITVPVEKIDAVYLSGAGDITSKTTLKSDTFKATISGSGDIKYRRNLTKVDTKSSGSVDIIKG